MPETPVSSGLGSAPAPDAKGQHLLWQPLASVCLFQPKTGREKQPPWKTKDEQQGVKETHRHLPGAQWPGVGPSLGTLLKCTAAVCLLGSTGKGGVHGTRGETPGGAASERQGLWAPSPRTSTRPEKVMRLRVQSGPRGTHIGLRGGPGAEPTI